MPSICPICRHLGGGMHIGIIGCGVVGGALMRWINKFTEHNLHVNDPHLGHHDCAYDQPIIFVAVPVPTKSMNQDLSILEDVIAKCKEDSLIFVRSSVLPGTCDRLSRKYNKYVCAMPEFLTERRADFDMERSKIFAGHPAEYKNIRPVIYSQLAEVFQYKKVISLKSNQECEMGKFMHNVYGAFKVTYFNMIKKQCDMHDISYDDALDVALHTGFINKIHTMVPGPDGKKGFGGRCFPVNLEAFIGFVGEDASHMLLNDVHCLNRLYRGLTKEDLEAWRNGKI